MGFQNEEITMKLSELEVKIQLNSREHLQSILAMCQKLYGPPTSQVIQLDEYYDTPEETLKKQDLVIRIRSIGESKTIALKSPRGLLPSGFSDRIELEFLAAEGKEVCQQLERQGLRVRVANEKQRWSFAHQETEVLLDILPFIGCFIEVEGPNEAAINEVLHSLKLSPEMAIRKHYGELMEDKLKELGLFKLPILSTFAAEEKWKSSLLSVIY